LETLQWTKADDAPEPCSKHLAEMSLLYLANAVASISDASPKTLIRENYKK